MYLLYLTIFIMFFQPAAIWPALEVYQPLRNSAILALLAYMFSQKRSAAPFFAEKVVSCQLSVVSYQSSEVSEDCRLKTAD
jgi:hypothetical protein